LRNTEGALKPESVSTKQERIAKLAAENPAMAFTSLNHYLDAEWLRYAYERTRKDGAVGVVADDLYVPRLFARMGQVEEGQGDGLAAHRQGSGGATLKAINQQCRFMRPWPVAQQHRRLCRMLEGHFAYFGITGNYQRLAAVVHQTRRIWRKWLSRRSWKSYVAWERFLQLVEIYPLPAPRIVHRFT
jgi:hypothetical protein